MENKIKEFLKSISIALFVALLIRSVIFEPFSIPSGSMKPNFLVGDYLFVSKFHYGISRYSFPFGPNLFEGRKFQLYKPERGDVVVFRIPTDPNIYYIKRLIGIPGDKIQVKEGILHINDTKIDIKPEGKFEDSDGKIININKETLPSGISYKILDETAYGYLDNTPLYEVPEGKYFFMGDNRDSSIDSRVIGGPVGFVPEEFLIGKASLILFCNDKPIWKLWEWIISFNLDRFFIKVQP